MNNNLFYKMPADFLQTKSISKILQSNTALSQFGLTMLMWYAIQDTKEKKISKSVLLNMFREISSYRQRVMALESGIFAVDKMTGFVSVNDAALYAGGQMGGQIPEQMGEQMPGQMGGQMPEQMCGQIPEQMQVPYSEDLEIELEIEGEGDTHETTTTDGIRNEELEMRNDPAEVIAEVRAMDPHKGELWIGVLLYCPDQELRRTMLEHWEQTMGYIEQHLKFSGRIDEVKDTKSLFAILQELVQPKSPIFGGLKLFLMQDAKSDTEKAFDKWLSGLSNICQMQQPLTYAQLQELGKAGYSAAQIRQTAERLNNYPNTPYKYVSAYQTIKEWLQNPRK